MVPSLSPEASRGSARVSAEAGQRRAPSGGQLPAGLKAAEWAAWHGVWRALGWHVVARGGALPVVTVSPTTCQPGTVPRDPEASPGGGRRGRDRCGRPESLWEGSTGSTHCHIEQNGDALPAQSRLCG